MYRITLVRCAETLMGLNITNENKSNSFKRRWADRKAKSKGAFLQLFRDIAPKTFCWASKSRRPSSNFKE